MIWIVLAAGLGVANFIFVALLFRRGRQLSRQLSDMRAERNSEWILRALQGAPARPALQVANGDAFEPLPAAPLPARRKRHLALYIGGLSTGLVGLGSAARRVLHTRRGQWAAAAVGAAAVAAAAAMLVINEGSADRRGPRSSAPTATATVTVAPPATPAPSPTGGPPATTGPPSASPLAGAPDIVSLTSTEDASGASAGGGRPDPPPAPPYSTSAGGSVAPSPPAGGPSLPATSEPPALPTPSPSPGTAGLCQGLALWPVLDLAACLAGGG